MLERKWKTLSGEKISDLPLHLRNILGSGAKEIHVGSDSQQCGSKTSYVTVLVILTPQKGGIVFYTEEVVSRVRDLRERLHKEAWMSTELSMELTATPDIGEAIVHEHDITVHIDANTEDGNGKFKSARWAQELAGMATSQGFKTLLKPNAWAASNVADHMIKQKVSGRR